MSDFYSSDTPIEALDKIAVALDSIDTRLDLIANEPSLLDRFAMAALTGLLASRPSILNGPETIARDAYLMAVAMLARKQLAEEAEEGAKS